MSTLLMIKVPLSQEEADLVESEKALLDCQREQFLTQEWAKELERRYKKKEKKKREEEAAKAAKQQQRKKQPSDDDGGSVNDSANAVDMPIQLDPNSKAGWRVELTRRRALFLARKMPELREKRLEKFAALEKCAVLLLPARLSTTLSARLVRCY